MRSFSSLSKKIKSLLSGEKFHFHGIKQQGNIQMRWSKGIFKLTDLHEYLVLLKCIYSVYQVFASGLTGSKITELAYYI